MSDHFIQRSVITLADSVGGYRGIPSKISTLAIGATDYIRLDVDRNVPKIDWVVSYDKAATLEFFTAEHNVNACTITLADATAVDNGDTFLFNGLTFTAESVEGNAIPSARKFWIPTQEAAAANLAALLADATFGVPGIGAITVTAPAATDVLTIGPGSASVYQLNKGTGDTNEFALAQQTLASLIKDNSTPSVIDTIATGNSTRGGTKFPQWTDGAPEVYLGITNNDAAVAMTYSVKAIRYWA